MNQVFIMLSAWIFAMKIQQILIFLLAVLQRNMFLFKLIIILKIRIFKIDKELTKKASEDNI